MPFTLYVNRAVSGNIRWRNLPDDCRHEADTAIELFGSGSAPMEGVLNVNNRDVARWCDIRDMWIEGQP